VNGAAELPDELRPEAMLGRPREADPGRSVSRAGLG
jgi:hypothetical protein